MTSTQTMLDRTARALGLPVSAFSDPRVVREHEETTERLDLGSRIREPADRRKVMGMVRAIVDRKGTG